MTLYVAVLAAGIVCGVLTAKSAKFIDSIRPPSPLGSIVQVVTYFLALPGLLVLGFLTLPWWAPIVAFIGLSLVVGMLLVNRGVMTVVAVLHPVWPWLTIGVAAFGWWRYLA